jgi:hypothetical protein
VNHDKALDLTIETFVVDQIIKDFASERPFGRELRIQNLKLQRILSEPRKFALPERLASKKARKRAGQRVQQIGQQAAKVRMLRDKFFKEFLRQMSEEQNLKVMTNAEFHIWKKKFDAALDGQIHEFRKQVQIKVMRRLGQS